MKRQGVAIAVVAVLAAACSPSAPSIWATEPNGAKCPWKAEWIAYKDRGMLPRCSGFRLPMDVTVTDERTSQLVPLARHTVVDFLGIEEGQAIVAEPGHGCAKAARVGANDTQRLLNGLHRLAPTESASC